MKIYVNLEGVAASRVRGVPHFTFSMLKALQTQHAVQQTRLVSLEDVSAYRAASTIQSEKVHGLRFRSAWWQPSDALVPWALRTAFRLSRQCICSARGEAFRRECDLELSCHHFQPRVTGLPRMTTCFDIHVFDVPWKYERPENLVDDFRCNLLSANAVMVPFIHPFKALPSLVPGIEEKAFYFDCPSLLRDVPLKKNVLRSVRERFMPRTGELVLLFPGALESHKNHKRLISAMADLRRAGRDCYLVCPGTDGPYRAKNDILEHTAALGMIDRVTFPGLLSSEEVRCLYDLCTAAVSPSLAEGGNMIAQEAVLFGKPVACADTGPSRAQAQLMGAEIPLFDPRNVGEMADAIWAVASDAPNYVARNRRAAELVAGWTWERVADRYVEVAQWILGGEKIEDRPLPIPPTI